MLLLGDLNYPLVGDASSRAVMLACCLERLSLTVYSHDSAPTRIGGTRRLDHIAVNWCLASSWALQEVQDCSGLSHAFEAYRDDLQTVLGSDHIPVQWEALVPQLPGCSCKRHQRRRPNMVGKRQVCKTGEAMEAVFQEQVMQRGGPGPLSGPGLLQCLQEVSAACTVPLRPPSYRDSDAVKQLIQARRMTVDPCVRKHLSLRIFQTRAQDRSQWRRQMLDKAAQGDWGARRAILRGAKKPAVFAPLVREQGGRDEAVRALQAHYHAKLGVAASVECDHSSVFQTLPWVAHADQVENEADLSGQEVCEHLFKMKSGTTTGMSGVSTDFLKAACGCDAGLHVVRSVLQDILDDPDCFEQGDLFEGLAVLMPKKKVVTTVRETRPIVLGDVVAKLLGRVCMARFLQYWPPPPCLFGGRRGVSVSDCIGTVKACLSKISVFQSSEVVIKLDLSGAYDSLDLAMVARFLARFRHETTHKSSRFIWSLLTKNRLTFAALGATWRQTVVRGTAQGATHSPSLFSHIVCQIMHDLQEQWVAAGHVPPFGKHDLKLWAVWFVDDALCFSVRSPKLLRCCHNCSMLSVAPA